MDTKFYHVITLIKRELMNQAITDGSELIYNSDNYAEPSVIASLWYRVGETLIKQNQNLPNIQVLYNFYVGFHTGMMTCGIETYHQAISQLVSIITSNTHPSITLFIEDCTLGQTEPEKLPLYIRCGRAMVLVPYQLGRDDGLVLSGVEKYSELYSAWEYFSMYAYSVAFHGDDNSAYCKMKRLMHDKIVEHYGQVSDWERRHVAFFVDNCNHESADRRASFIFMCKLKEMGYHITLIYPTSQGEIPQQDVCDDHIQLPVITQRAIEEVKASLSFDCVFYFTHMNVWSLILASLRIGRVQVGMLGQVVTSALPSIDYFITPKWDNPDNYTETTIPLPGMGCALTTVNIDTQPPFQRDSAQVIIYCPWSVTKFTAQSYQYLDNIRKRCPQVVFLFHVAGHHSYQHYVAKLALFIRDLPHVVSDDESEGYYQNFVNCDMALMPYPTSGFTTVVDSLSMGKPVFAIDHPYNYGTRCAGQILKLLEFGDFVAPDMDTSVNNICTFIESGKYRTFKPSEKFMRIIDTHNKSLAHAFGEWVSETLPLKEV